MALVAERSRKSLLAKSISSSSTGHRLSLLNCLLQHDKGYMQRFVPLIPTENHPERSHIDRRVTQSCLPQLRNLRRTDFQAVTEYYCFTSFRTLD